MAISACPNALAAQAKECGPKVGSKITTVDIRSIIAMLENAGTVRDEFETSAAYNDRLKAIGKKLPEVWIVSVPHKPGHVSYDADARRLNISKWLFLDFDNPPGYSSLDYRDALAYVDNEGKYKTRIQVDARDNLGVPLSRRVTVADKYDGTNSFGRTVKITRQKATTQAIFERAGGIDEDVFSAPIRPGSAPRTSKVVFSLPIDPTTARTLKTSVRAAVLIAPKPPYFGRGSVYHKRPTLTAPYDIEEELQVVVADIKCALVLDGVGTVLATRPTR